MTGSTKIHALELPWMRPSRSTKVDWFSLENQLALLM